MNRRPAHNHDPLPEILRAVECTAFPGSVLEALIARLELGK